MSYFESAVIGNTIHVEIDIVEKAEREHPRAIGTVRHDAAVKNQDDETVLRCELRSLVR